MDNNGTLIVYYIDANTNGDENIIDNNNNNNNNNNNTNLYNKIISLTIKITKIIRIVKIR